MRIALALLAIFCGCTATLNPQSAQQRLATDPRDWDARAELAKQLADDQPAAALEHLEVLDRARTLKGRALKRTYGRIMALKALGPKS
jgi:thioredoxin-like negative regulator of GroEL